MLGFRWRAAAVVLAVVAAFVVPGPPATAAATTAAVASVAGPVQYVGDAVGKVFTVAVRNSGTRSLGAVQVDVPGKAWRVAGCPAGPAGWARVVSAQGCSFRSPAGPAGNIGPGATVRFQVKARTLPSDRDRKGTWKVLARSDSPVQYVTARPGGRGLQVQAYSLEITNVLSRGPVRGIGSACPATVRSAKAGSRTVLVICGRNHARVPFALNPGSAKLAGDFGTPGRLVSGRVKPGRASVVVANYADVLVSKVLGANRKVALTLTSTSGQRAPRVTYGGFSVTDLAPVAKPVSQAVTEDVPTAVTLVATDPDGDTTTFKVLTGPAHGKLSGLSGPSCSGSPGRTCRTQTTYVPVKDYAGPDSFRYQVRDDFGKTVTATAKLSVAGVNDAPTRVNLNPQSVREGLAAPALVGALTTSDPDAGDRFSYALVPGDGDADNALFAISGTSLLTAVVLDRETKPTASVRIRSTDGGGVFVDQVLLLTVRNTNEPPTGITLDRATVLENQPAATTVGTLSTTDPDPDDTHSYALVPTSGGDEAGFALSGPTLSTTVPFDREARSSYALVVRSTDLAGEFVDTPLTITVVNANEPPAAPVLTGSALDENQAPGSTIGTLSATDPDGDALTYSLAAGPDAAAFTVVGTALRSAKAFDFETRSSYSLRLLASDGSGGSSEATVTVTVRNVSEAPAGVALSSTTVPENSTGPALVGTLSAVDPDGDAVTFALPAGAGDNASFTVSGSALRTVGPFDRETKGSYSVSVVARDAGGLASPAAAFTVVVGNVNEQPTDLALSNVAVPEGAAPPTAVGTLSTVDPDGGTFGYAFADGGADNRLFSLAGAALNAEQSFNYETRHTYSVRIRSTDEGGLWTEKAFTIEVTNANEKPTSLDLSGTTVPENSKVGTVVGTLSSTDPDAGDSASYSLPTGLGDNGSFQVQGTTVVTTNSFDFEAKAAYTLTVRVTDGGKATFDQTVTIQVTNVNDPPLDLVLHGLPVGAPATAGTHIATFSTEDPDAGDTFVYGLVAGVNDTDNGSFRLSGNELRSAVDLVAGEYRIRVSSTDTGDEWVDRSFTITVTP
ncbi:MAG: hypothetical protein JWN87_921 [Frankiales bacterium]|nr:hypothetical protein [Frankiales bacterium]